MKKRVICVFTATRAEYGLLRWLMEEIQQDPDLVLQILVSGTHLSPEFGNTYRVIEEDGFVIDEKVEMVLSSDSPIGISKSLGIGTIGFAEALDRLNPDILVVLGDRYEALGIAQVALIAKIPVAHIHGGEKTSGSIDEQIRHAVTKLSHIHFVSADPHRSRVIQMGENPDRVFFVGAPGLDAISRLQLLSKQEFEKSIDFELGEQTFLIAYHPATLASTAAEDTASNMFAALEKFPDAKVIVTGHNADTYGRSVGAIANKFVRRRPEQMRQFKNLGQLLFLSAISHSNVLIGNSSSGLIEVPAFKKPTVNIGPRQNGRLRASSVIDCGESEEEIVSAIKMALSKNFQADLSRVDSPYQKGNACILMKETLKNVGLDGIVVKQFRDC